jgi:hypothetical protein
MSTRLARSDGSSIGPCTCPRYRAIPFSLGFAYWSSDQRDAAIREWREVLRRDPNDERVKQVLSRAVGGS